MKGHEVDPAAPDTAPRIVPGREGVDIRALPAGHTRDEQRRKNADTLAAQAAEDPQERIDPAKLDRIKNDRDIRQKYEPGGWGNPYNRLRIQHSQPGFVYCLVCTRGESVQVDFKLQEMVPDAEGYAVPVWEIVCGEWGTVYPETAITEAPNWKDVHGFRRVGDTILLRARKDRYMLLMREQKRMNEAKANASAANVEELAERFQRAGHGVIARVNSPLSDPRLRREAQRAAAKGIARHEFEDQLRDGTIKGMEIGR